MSLDLLDFRVNAAHAAYGGTPASQYAAWAAVLGVSEYGTDGDINDDDAAFVIDLGVAFFPGAAATQFFVSSEAGVGFFETDPTNTTSTAYSLASYGISRMYGTSIRPNLLLAYHPQCDLQSLDGKYRVKDGVCIIYVEHRVYTGGTTCLSYFALRIEQGKIELVAQAPTGTSIPVTLVELDPSTGNYLQHSAEYTSTGPETLFWTVELVQMVSEGTLRAPSVLGVPTLQGPLPLFGDLRAWLPQPTAQGTVPQAGHFVVPLPSPQFIGSLTPAGRALAPFVCSTPTLAGIHDFTTQIPEGSVVRHFCDFSGGATTLRLPISSWSATIQQTLKQYLQVAIPNVGAWVEELAERRSLGAEFWVLRAVTLPDGRHIEQELARAPMSTLRFDQGPLRFTGSVSGYADPVESAVFPEGYTRTLRGVSLLSLTDATVRVRSAIDWLLRPGHTVIAAGYEFGAAYIIFTVTESQDYMDVGSRSE